MKASVRIVNVVATVTLNQTLDLNSIVKAFPSIEYRPERFPGAVFKLKKPKTANLIFKTGKMVCVGATSERQVKRAVMKVIQMLKDNDIIVGRPIIEVVNIVASASLEYWIDLEKAVYALDRVMYEPEQFPGAVYQMEELKVVILIFHNGKIVITGAKTEDQVYEAVARLWRRVEEERLYITIP